jgi:hypothetical protein
MAITLIICCNLKGIPSLGKGGEGDFVLSLMSLGQNPYLENTLINAFTLILKYSLLRYTTRKVSKVTRLIAASPALRVLFSPCIKKIPVL